MLHPCACADEKLSESLSFLRRSMHPRTYHPAALCSRQAAGILKIFMQCAYHPCPLKLTSRPSHACRMRASTQQIACEAAPPSTPPMRICNRQVAHTCPSPTPPCTEYTAMQPTTPRRCMAMRWESTSMVPCLQTLLAAAVIAACRASVTASANASLKLRCAIQWPCQEIAIRGNKHFNAHYILAYNVHVRSDGHLVLNISQCMPFSSILPTLCSCGLLIGHDIDLGDDYCGMSKCLVPWLNVMGKLFGVVISIYAPVHAVTTEQF